MPIRRVRIRRRRPTLRRFLPALYPTLGLILLAAVSTDTMLASDACSVSIVQTLTDAARAAQQHIVPAHTHTHETIVKWEEWGNAYLAKHGHPYEPPAHNASLAKPASFEESDSPFKFECEVLPLLPVDLEILPALPDVDEAPIETEIPLPVQTPVSLPVLPQYSTGNFNFPGTPVPLGGTPFGGVTPEPGSFVLLGTGMAALLAFRKHAQRDRLLKTIVSPLP